jgi:hypothetical protein
MRLAEIRLIIRVEVAELKLVSLLCREALEFIMLQTAVKWVE